MKDAFYFPHDYNARGDLNISKLLRVMGWRGYGLYWAMVEMLYEACGRLPLDFETIAFALQAKPEEVKQLASGFDLFYHAGRFLASHSVDRRLDERKAKSDRAKASAAAKWGDRIEAPMRPHTERTPTAMLERKGKERKGKERQPTPHLAILEAWKAHPSLPQPIQVGTKRDGRAKARWEEHPDPAYWAGVVAKIAASDFCRGKNDRAWKADIDFLLQPDASAKVLEGKYDNRGASAPAAGRDPEREEGIRLQAEAMARPYP